MLLLLGLALLEPGELVGLLLGVEDALEPAVEALPVGLWLSDIAQDLITQQRSERARKVEEAWTAVCDLARGGDT